ncbi:Arachidonate 15-lipoxygenase precursor [Cystobacter fuscus]|uniref:Arachidonate 15-lipoxygenase n=1 Tax=Cystobacter fuscus TaxID=43 RepID=A0A250J098_9BACT|nr:lipoxygenase family protein [Cystobacter fuscus]ATB36877.1 Arachidonate 15-lipoxygenase precursor [Cystobacter fuscus]
MSDPAQSNPSASVAENTGPDTFLFGSASAHSDPKRLYRYDYKKLAPLAMIETLPKAEKPSLQWMMQCVQLSLRAVHNRLHWDDAVSYTDVDTAELDLSDLGLGTVNLDAAPLHAVKPHEAAAVAPAHFDQMSPEQLAAALPGEEGPLSFGGEESGPGVLSVLKLVATISRELIKKGITDPLGILEFVLKRSNVNRSGRPRSLDDYARLFATFERPWFADRYDSDEVFAYLRVAGFNPLVLQRVATPGEKFPVTDAQFRVSIGDAGDSLALAGSEGRLFLCDYAALARVKNGNFPVGPKYCFAPLALFALPRGASGAQRLHAVAIQCGQDPRNHPIFTPADGDAWRKAKVVVTVADFNHHELISHLGRTHLLIGPMVIATRRCLPDEHPVSTLLRPHFEGTLNINDMAQSTLVAPGHEVDKSLAGTIWESRRVAAEGLLARPFNELFLPADLEARGVTSDSLEYPYREDALELWHAIEEWVSSYVKLYYRSDEQVRADAALQEWAAEIVSREGGRIRGFGDAGDGRIQTVAYLCQALTMIIFTASAQHAAVNAPQAELMTYAPATPPAAYRAAPLSELDSEANDYLDYLPPLEMATLQMEFLHLLGGVFYTRLGHYETHWFKDKQVGEPLAHFQKKLDELESLISERNHTRFGPYPFLLPSRVPQSINI